MFVTQVPVLNTLHITMASAEFLTSPHARRIIGIVAQYDAGWFIFVGCRELDWDGALEELPADLRAVFTWAAERGYKWVRLDGGTGDVVEELPTYDEDWK